MPKYRVYQIATASYFVGEFEAENEEQAITLSQHADHSPQLCHQCSKEIEIGDWYEEQVDEVPQ